MTDNINKISDYIDEIAMLYYESKVLVNPKVSYLECLAKSLNAFLDDEPFKGENLIDRNVEQMLAIIDKAVQIPINEEELRKALEKETNNNANIQKSESEIANIKTYHLIILLQMQLQ